MRSFTTQEQDIIKKLLGLKNKGDLKSLQVASLLREHLNILALKWEVEPKCSVSLYSDKVSPERRDWKELSKEYFRIVDFIYFVEELEVLGLVKFQYISFEKDKKRGERVLYDREKYEYSSDVFWFKGQSEKQRLYFIDSVIASNFSNEFAKDLEKCADAIIYPLPLMADFVNRGFVSIEEDHYQEQLRRTDKSISTANIGVIIAALSILITVIFSIINLYTVQETKIINHDADKLNDAILELKHQVIDSVNNVDSTYKPVNVTTINKTIQYNKKDTCIIYLQPQP